MEAESGCRDALTRAFWSLDRFDYESVLACFDVDAVWVRQGVECVGRESIRANLEQRDRDTRICHVLSNLLVTAWSSDSATTTGYNTAYRGMTQAVPALPRPGEALGLWEFHARLRKAKEGWLIVDLRQVHVLDFLK